MLEERRIYLEEIEDYANGFYTRDLFTKYGKVQDLKVLRVRNGGFRPAILPERRKDDLDLTSAVITLYVFTSKIFRLIKVTEDKLSAFSIYLER